LRLLPGGGPKVLAFFSEKRWGDFRGMTEFLKKQPRGGGGL